MDYSKLSISELEYIIKDCHAAIKARPDGENVSKYLDQIDECASELYKRRKG